MEVDEVEEEIRFQEQRNRVVNEVTAFLLEWYGERCDEFQEGCACCERYKALDFIVEDFTE